MRVPLTSWQVNVFAVVTATVLVGCRAPMPDVNPEPPTLRRLTNVQYANTVRDLFGDDIVIPGELDPDERFNGLLAVGAGRTAFSPRGVENVETSSYLLAEQAMEPERRDALVPCTPYAAEDPDCAEQFVVSFGRRAWRRPLSADEVSRYAGLGTSAASTLGDFYDGLEFAIAGLLQAPDFLYRVELGAASSGDIPRQYTDWEMASRLSFLLWNTTPDDELLDAAAAGELSEESGLVAQTERLLASPRATEGLTAWFDDWMHFADLDDLYKEPLVFPHMSDTLGESARQESQRLFKLVAFDREDDMRELLTSRRTFVDRELAALYEIPAPVRDGFAAYEHPEESQRRGLLGHASFLALNAHPVSTSATLRGKFVREVFLCAELPGPPAGVDTSIPPVTEAARTLRDRVQQHLADPSCASCHRNMDLVGLGFENFDGIGRFRTLEEGVPIDSSGELDDVVFDNAAGLAEALREHEDLGPCITKTLTRYANGYREDLGQLEALNWLADDFADQGYQLQPLLIELTSSPLFRASAEVDTSPLEEL
ncbi:MAG: DUF1592 domain-containing protein [Deltaproteobacteria bacterium]|nr:DUF1592 domain-containing protein [Deltaproteobacteria bacterium]